MIFKRAFVRDRDHTSATRKTRYCLVKERPNADGHSEQQYCESEPQKRLAKKNATHKRKRPQTRDPRAYCGHMSAPGTAYPGNHVPCVLVLFSSGRPTDLTLSCAAGSARRSRDHLNSRSSRQLGCRAEAGPRQLHRQRHSGPAASYSRFDLRPSTFAARFARPNGSERVGCRVFDLARQHARPITRAEKVALPVG